jgi:hypothetical protein
MKNTIIVLSFFIYFAFSSESWFVSPTRGNDSNFGRKNSPFKTFDRAYDVSSNGDSIMLEKDTYFFVQRHYSKDFKIVGIPDEKSDQPLPVLIGLLNLGSEHISFENVKFENSNNITSHFSLWVVGCESLLLRNVIFNSVKTTDPDHIRAFRIGGRKGAKLVMENVQFFNYNLGNLTQTTAQFERTGPSKPALLTISNVSLVNSSGLAAYEYENVIIKDLTMSGSKQTRGTLTVMSSTNIRASGVIINGGDSGISILRSTSGTFEDCIISGVRKMAIEASYSKFTMKNSILFGNHAETNPMISLIGSNIEMVGGKIVHNFAQNGNLVKCGESSKFQTTGTFIQGNVGRINCQ